MSPGDTQLRRWKLFYCWNTPEIFIFDVKHGGVSIIMWGQHGNCSGMKVSWRKQLHKFFLLNILTLKLVYVFLCSEFGHHSVCLKIRKINIDVAR